MVIEPLVIDDDLQKKFTKIWKEPEQTDLEHVWEAVLRAPPEEVFRLVLYLTRINSDFCDTVLYVRIANYLENVEL